MIESLENQWRDALCKKDIEALKRLLHPDFVLIGSRAAGAFSMTRGEWLEAIERRDVDSIDIEVRDASVLEHVLVGTVLARWRIKYMSRVIEDCVLLTDVWVFDDGRWRVIRRHSTPAPAGECAGSS
ncbi:nuclear transport factor 2 family protein [Sphingomonas sp. F9_3S_D5_B_2]